MKNLPHLVLEHVFKYLNVQDSCSMRLVCSRFNQIFLQFSNPHFINSLHYVQLESDEKLRLFLSTFSQAEVPIPFPRFVWNAYIGSDAEVNDLGTLYASTIVELSITIYRSIDIYADKADFEPLSPMESLMRVSAFLHLVGSTLEMLRIVEHIMDIMSVEEIPVPVLPKLTILDGHCFSILEWIAAIVRKAPALEFLRSRDIIFPFGRYYKLAGIGPNLKELEYYPGDEDEQNYSEKWFLANARRYQRMISHFSIPAEGITGACLRLWNDQIRNFEVLYNVFDVEANHVFPRVRTLWTSPRTWLENPLKLFSPTKLPRLRCVIVSGYLTNLSTLDFPADLSYIYPNVVELRVSVEPGGTYEVLPYYKLFPNVTTLRLERQVTRNLIGLLKHFPKVRHLVIHYGGIPRGYFEDHDFDLECGANPDVVSFKHLERLEYRHLNGSEELMSRLIRSARASALSQLKSVYLWYFITKEAIGDKAAYREYSETVKTLELPNVVQLQEFFEIKWWISHQWYDDLKQLV